MSSYLTTHQHWYFDADNFEPSATQLKFLLDMLPDADQAKVTKYRSLKDQKLSLISALIQRAKIRETFTCSNEDFTIKRTSHNKPFATSENVPILQWNYNVSHHGSYVTILSDHSRPIGVDLVQRSVRKSWKDSASKYITQFSGQLTFLERQACLKHACEWEKYTHFFVIWSLKEAYIKAVGKGLSMDLLSVSFQVQFQNLSMENVMGIATVKIDGCEKPEWEFSFSSLDAQHVVTVAQGPTLEEEDGGFQVYSSSRKKQQEVIDGEEGEMGIKMEMAEIQPTQVQLLDLLSPADQVQWKKLVESLRKERNLFHVITEEDFKEVIPLQ